MFNEEEILSELSDCLREVCTVQCFVCNFIYLYKSTIRIRFSRTRLQRISH